MKKISHKMESRKLMENKFTEFDKNTNESDFFLKGGEMLFFID